MTISTVASCLDPLVRLAGAVVLGNVFGRSALWFGWPVGWAAALLLPVIMYVECLARRNFNKLMSDGAESTVTHNRLQFTRAIRKITIKSLKIR